MNTGISSYFETSGGQISNLYLNVVHIFNTGVNYTSVAISEGCFSALVSNVCSSIAVQRRYLYLIFGIKSHQPRMFQEKIPMLKLRFHSFKPS
jgi:hypothetical protein